MDPTQPVKKKRRLIIGRRKPDDSHTNLERQQQQQSILTSEARAAHGQPNNTDSPIHAGNEDEDGNDHRIVKVSMSTKVLLQSDSETTQSSHGQPQEGNQPTHQELHTDVKHVTAQCDADNGDGNTCDNTLINKQILNNSGPFHLAAQPVFDDPYTSHHCEVDGQVSGGQELHEGADLNRVSQDIVSVPQCSEAQKGWFGSQCEEGQGRGGASRAQSSGLTTQCDTVQTPSKRRKQGASKGNIDVQVYALMDILGSCLSTDQAVKLLAKHKGKVSAAVNDYFDQPANTQLKHLTHTPSNKPSQLCTQNTEAQCTEQRATDPIDTGDSTILTTQQRDNPSLVLGSSANPIDIDSEVSPVQDTPVTHTNTNSNKPYQASPISYKQPSINQKQLPIDETQPLVRQKQPPIHAIHCTLAEQPTTPTTLTPIAHQSSTPHIAQHPTATTIPTPIQPTATAVSDTTHLTPSPTHVREGSEIDGLVTVGTPPPSLGGGAAGLHHSGSQTSISRQVKEKKGTSSVVPGKSGSKGGTKLFGGSKKPVQKLLSSYFTSGSSKRTAAKKGGGGVTQRKLTDYARGSKGGGGVGGGGVGEEQRGAGGLGATEGVLGATEGVLGEGEVVVVDSIPSITQKESGYLGQQQIVGVGDGDGAGDRNSGGDQLIEQASGGVADTMQGGGVLGGKTSSIDGLTATEQVDRPQLGTVAQQSTYNARTRPQLDAQQHVPYSHVARALRALDGTTKRLQHQNILSEYFKHVVVTCQHCLVAATFLTMGQVGDAHEGVELGVGSSAVVQALTLGLGIPRTSIKTNYAKFGDLGDAAHACRRGQTTLNKPAPLTIPSAFSSLQKIASISGKGAHGRKVQCITQLLTSCQGDEIKYMVRTLIQNLRVGAGWRSVIPALGRGVAAAYAAGAGDHPPTRSALDSVAKVATAAYQFCPSVPTLIEKLLNQPRSIQTLNPQDLITPGVPVRPMLARMAAGYKDAVSILGSNYSHGFSARGGVLVEYKYDGQRAQVHVYKSGRVRIFSRNCQEWSSSFPDVMHAVLSGLERARADARDLAREAGEHSGDPHKAGGVGSRNEDGQCATHAMGDVEIILDGEIVGVNKQEGQVRTMRAFQELATRGRGDVARADVSVQVCYFVFDILYYNGQSLVQLDLQERRAVLLRAMHFRIGDIELAAGWEVREGSVTPVGTVPPCQVQDGWVGGDGGLGGEGEGQGVDGRNGIDYGGVEGGGSAGVDPGGVNGGGMGGSDVRCGLVEQEEVGVNEVHGGAALDQADGDCSGAKAEQQCTKKGLQIQEWFTLLISKLIKQALAGGAEGIVLKIVSYSGDAKVRDVGRYMASKRNSAWVKLKGDYCADVADTVDVVPIGAWYGNGRKKDWFSPWLLAVYDRESGVFQSLCRCMSGFSDQFYEEATKRFSTEYRAAGKKSYYCTGENPPIWFEAKEVWEVRGAELSLSPVHMAAIGVANQERGLGLRFPRFVRIREDKGVDDATGPRELAAMFTRQVRRAGEADGKDGGTAKGSVQEESESEGYGGENDEDA